LCCIRFLLLLPSRIPECVLKLQADITLLLSKKQRLKVYRIFTEKFGAARGSEEIKRITRDYFRIQTSFFYYTLFLVTLRKKMWFSRYVVFEGLEHLDRSLASHHGVIMPTFHFNHPIAVPGLLIYKGYKITGYAVHPWDLNVPLVAKIVTWIGYKGGMLREDLEMAYRNRGARDVYMRRLKEDGSLVVLLDMPFFGKKSLKPVDFLGEPFLFPSGITEIIYETGCPVHVAYCVRDNLDWRRARVVVSPPLAMSGDALSDLQTIVTALDKAVQEHPEQWWGWVNYERGTPAFHEKLRAHLEATRPHHS